MRPSSQDVCADEAEARSNGVHQKLPPSIEEAERLARALLHIGLEKTGTTAVQEFLQINRHTLLEQHRIWTPDYLGRGSQWLLAALAYDAAREDDLTANLGSPTARQARLDEVRRKITYSVRHQPADLFCFSSEHLSSRLTTTAELHSLKRFLSDLFDEIRIVLYVREPIRMAISRQSTVVKLGHASFQLPAPARAAAVLDFRAVIERWEAVFPGGMCIRLYDEASEQFNLIADFCSVLGLSAESDQLQPPSRANPSLSWEHLRLLSAINTAAHQQAGRPLPGAVLQQITAFLEQTENRGAGYQPTAAQQEAYRRYFAEQTEWLFRTYFPDRPHHWNPPTAMVNSARQQGEPTLQRTRSEEMLCRLVVSLADNTAVAWADIAEHLAQIAWKIREKEPLNQHDQETSERFCASIRSAMANDRIRTRQPAAASTPAAA